MNHNHVHYPINNIYLPFWQTYQICFYNNNYISCLSFNYISIICTLLPMLLCLKCYNIDIKFNTTDSVVIDTGLPLASLTSINLQVKGNRSVSICLSSIVTTNATCTGYLLKINNMAANPP